MKKFIALMVAAVMLFGVAACSSSTDEKKEDTTTKTEETTTTEEASDEIKQMLADFEASLVEQIGEMPEATGDEKIGVLIISLTNPFWATMKECYESAAEELGITVEVQTGTTEGDTQSQLDTLMTMADMDYDAIIVSPIDGTNLIPGIVKCNENNIPVINLGPGVDLDALETAGGHLDGKITVKFEDQGTIVASDMVTRLPEGGQVAILEGLSGAGQSVGRTKGATDIFNLTEGIELVASQPCDWDATKAYDATKDLIQAYPDLKGIFACNDVMALAAIEALQAEGKTDVLVYGVDYTADAKAAMEAGTMTGTMSYSSVIYTKAALQMGIKLSQGGTFENNIYLPLTLVTKDNVAGFTGWK